MQSETGDTEKVFSHCSRCQFIVQLLLVSHLLKYNILNKESKVDNISICLSKCTHKEDDMKPDDSHPRRATLLPVPQRRKSHHFVTPSHSKELLWIFRLWKGTCRDPGKLRKRNRQPSFLIEKKANDYAHSAKQQASCLELYPIYLLCKPLGKASLSSFI